MQTMHQLQAVPDDELLRRLADLLAGSRHAEADLVAHIGEVDVRRLYAREATPSMFVYCTERLHLSEAEACLRIAAARASREHPVLLEMLADGRLHLSAIAKIAPHLTRENRDALLLRATHKTKREVDELVAELVPQPDVPGTIRRIPVGRFVAQLSPAARADVSAVPPVEIELQASAPAGTPASGASNGRSGASDLAQPSIRVFSTAEPRLEQVDSERLDAAGAPGAVTTGVVGIESESSSDGERPSSQEHRWVAAPRRRSAVVEPLAPARYKVQFTASAELREKLERLQALMRSSIPDCDLAAVIDAAVTEKLEKLEARRFGRTKSPRRTVSESDTAPKTRHVPAAVKRAVGESDEHRCRYVDTHGNRCTARVGLEYHHRQPFALGGDHAPGNVSLLCHVHNRLLAEVDYGREAVGKRRRCGSGFTAVVPPTRARAERLEGGRLGARRTRR
jgi:hypothetical protein